MGSRGQRDSAPRRANPVLGEDHPDPHVVRATDAGGRVTYYVYPTAGSGDFVVWSSRDLVRWTRPTEGLFRRGPAGASRPTAGTTAPSGRPTRLRASCPHCGELLSFTREHQGQTFVREGTLWGVYEGGSLFHCGSLVYALMSGSTWDSAYYWVAAPTPEGLASDNPARIAGRLLVPGRGQSFGHGTTVLGPDGEHWFYVHHRLQADRCRTTGQCARDVWVTPMTFDDRGDGRGAVWLRARFPADDPAVAVPL